MRIKLRRAAVVLLAAGILIGVLERRAISSSYHKVMGVTGRVYRVVRKATLTGTRMCLCRADRELRLSRSDGLELAGSLYEPGGRGLHPGILLLHGMTPVGRDSPVYRVLASELSKRGFTVLSIDFAGFGDSGDPYTHGNEEALDLTQDVLSAYRLMLTFDNIERNNITLIAHSMGSNYAIKAFTEEPGIRRLAMIGPPRRSRERLSDPEKRMRESPSFEVTHAEYLYLRQQKIRQDRYGQPFPDWWTLDRHSDHYSRMGIDNYLDILSEEGHRPVFLIDGELEDERDKHYLEDYYARMSEPKRFFRVPNADHHLNTGEVGRALVFDKTAVSSLSDEIVLWMKAN